jgi:hypothetical protein
MIESPPPWGEPRIGEWPTEPMGAPELSVATETLTGAPLEKIQIVILRCSSLVARAIRSGTRRLESRRHERQGPK